MTSRNAAAVLFLLLLAAGCRKSEPPATPVARVDAQTLTLEHVLSEFDTAQGVSQAQVYAYVQQWLTDELLYREALRRGLDRQPELERKLQGIRRQLIISGLLEDEVYGGAAGDITPEEIDRYYEANRTQFVLGDDVALLSLVLFSKREAASAFRTKVVRGTPWAVAVAEARTDSALGESLLAAQDSVYHKEVTLLPAELWRVATGVARQEPSFPVRTADGYYVVVVWKLLRRGETADRRYVEDEIRNRLLIEQRQRRYREFLQNLRARHDIQVLISRERSDSLQLMPGSD